MIEGLKVRVNAQELKGLCVAQAAYHRSRAADYERNLAKLEALSQPGTSMQPGREAADKIKSHKQSAAELDFISTHLVESETYQLEGSDLYKLGIAGRAY